MPAPLLGTSTRYRLARITALVLGSLVFLYACESSRSAMFSDVWGELLLAACLGLAGIGAAWFEITLSNRHGAQEAAETGESGEFLLESDNRTIRARIAPSGNLVFHGREIAEDGHASHEWSWTFRPTTFPAIRTALGGGDGELVDLLETVIPELDRHSRRDPGAWVRAHGITATYREKGDNPSRATTKLPILKRGLPREVQASRTAGLPVTSFAGRGTESEDDPPSARSKAKPSGRKAAGGESSGAGRASAGGTKGSASDSDARPSTGPQAVSGRASTDGRRSSTGPEKSGRTPTGPNGRPSTGSETSGRTPTGSDGRPSTGPQATSGRTPAGSDRRPPVTGPQAASRRTGSTESDGPSARRPLSEKFAAGRDSTAKSGRTPSPDASNGAPSTGPRAGRSSSGGQRASSARDEIGSPTTGPRAATGRGLPGEKPSSRATGPDAGPDRAIRSRGRSASLDAEYDDYDDEYGPDADDEFDEDSPSLRARLGRARGFLSRALPQRRRDDPEDYDDFADLEDEYYLDDDHVSDDPEDDPYGVEERPRVRAKADYDDYQDYDVRYDDLPSRARGGARTRAGGTDRSRAGADAQRDRAAASESTRDRRNRANEATPERDRTSARGESAYDLADGASGRGARTDLDRHAPRDTGSSRGERGVDTGYGAADRPGTRGEGGRTPPPQRGRGADAERRRSAEAGRGRGARNGRATANDPTARAGYDVDSWEPNGYAEDEEGRRGPSRQRPDATRIAPRTPGDSWSDYDQGTRSNRSPSRNGTPAARNGANPRTAHNGANPGSAGDDVSARAGYDGAGSGGAYDELGSRPARTAGSGSGRNGSGARPAHNGEVAGAARRNAGAGAGYLPEDTGADDAYDRRSRAGGVSNGVAGSTPHADSWGAGTGVPPWSARDDIGSNTRGDADSRGGNSDSWGGGSGVPPWSARDERRPNTRGGADMRTGRGATANGGDSWGVGTGVPPWSARDEIRRNTFGGGDARAGGAEAGRGAEGSWNGFGGAPESRFEGGAGIYPNGSRGAGSGGRREFGGSPSDRAGSTAFPSRYDDLLPPQRALPAPPVRDDAARNWAGHDSGAVESSGRRAWRSEPDYGAEQVRSGVERESRSTRGETSSRSRLVDDIAGYSRHGFADDRAAGSSDTESSSRSAPIPRIPEPEPLPSESGFSSREQPVTPRRAVDPLDPEWNPADAVPSTRRSGRRYLADPAEDAASPADIIEDSGRHGLRAAEPAPEVDSTPSPEPPPADSVPRRRARHGRDEDEPRPRRSRHSR
ncbi:hypothetical protein ACWEKT_05710 [Nocardia takedensis]